VDRLQEFPFFTSKAVYTLELLKHFTNTSDRASADPNLKVLILKFREAHHLDANGVLLLRDLAETLKAGNRHLILCELKPDTFKIFVNADLVTFSGF
jgi:SulP family sulfate permease